MTTPELSWALMSTYMGTQDHSWVLMRAQAIIVPCSWAKALSELKTQEFQWVFIIVRECNGAPENIWAIMGFHQQPWALLRSWAFRNIVHSWGYGFMAQNSSVLTNVNQCSWVLIGEWRNSWIIKSTWFNDKEPTLILNPKNCQKHSGHCFAGHPNTLVG